VLRSSRDKTLLLISGGPDSVFLFHRYLKRRKRDGGLDFAVLHVNHGLRGAESDADEAFVRELCAAHGVTCFARRLDPGVFKAGNLQETARRWRLKFCFELQRDGGFATAVTAHHADDVLETLVMRSSRGAGLAGLCGIRRNSFLCNPFLAGSRLKLSRPLIDLTKQEILAGLRAEGIGFRTDSSNLSDKYFRNRVRRGLAECGGEMEAQSGVGHSAALSLSRALQSADDYFRVRVAFLSKRHRHFVPLREWDTWPEEIRFRFFASKMRRNGYRKQIERRHFAAVSRENAKLVLDGAHFFKDGSGCYFYSRGALEEMKRPRTVVAPGAYLFGPWEDIIAIRADAEPAGGFPVLVGAVGQYGSTPLKSTFIETPRGRMSLKDWFYAQGVPKYARILRPVVGGGC
jgi:tRNA(Ile)-lysidine synthetase-like protein